MTSVHGSFHNGTAPVRCQYLPSPPADRRAGQRYPVARPCLAVTGPATACTEDADAA